jgi:two-component sensor histidine kinase
MSLIHAKLYESANLAEADFYSFVRELAVILLRAYAADPSAITVRVTGADTRLGIDVVVPCSLIVNELLSNSLKHAFAPGQKGAIRVSLSRNDGRVRLSVADNGKGLPEGLDFRDTTSLGMRLVMMLVEQLDGSISSLSRRRGTEFRVEFPERAAAC